MNSFIKKNYLKIILLSLIIFSFILNMILSFNIIPIRGSVDDFQHFYDMYRWYKKEEFPVTSTRFEGSDTYKETHIKMNLKLLGFREEHIIYIIFYVIN